MGTLKPGALDHGFVAAVAVTVQTVLAMAVTRRPPLLVAGATAELVPTMLTWPVAVLATTVALTSMAPEEVTTTCCPVLPTTLTSVLAVPDRVEMTRRAPAVVSVG
jgi:hypothetical protein